MIGASRCIYTYCIGRSLYVPLTSRCNSWTLPQTRGPSFVLPCEVVTALCRVRDAEHGTQQYQHWCSYLDTQDYPQRLPEYPYELVGSIPSIPEPDESNNNSHDSQVDNNNDLAQQPTAEHLQKEIDTVLEQKEIDALVISGEGEPTLRWKTLRLIATTYADVLPIRLNTNGLIPHTSAKTDELYEWGIRTVSVLLPTADPHQYVEMMKPIGNDHDNDNHLETVCQFIRNAIQSGLDTEVTAIDRPDVNKTQTEALAMSLGVQPPVRWRPYFP